MSDSAPITHWHTANRRVIAKSLAELIYEQALEVRRDGDLWRVALSSGTSYVFAARHTVWDWLHIEAASIRRETATQNLAATDAGQFFIDAAADLSIPPATLGNLLHETANTLSADVALLSTRSEYSAAAMAQMADEDLQCLLDGHPKAMLNKGRIGWGADEFARYATESARSVQLEWLAVQRDSCISGHASAWSEAALLAESLDAEALKGLNRAADKAAIDRDAYHIMPVHPWQWQAHIRQHYAAAIAARQIVPLGAFGDAYLPQVSLRTLSNRSRPRALHIKLPLTVLNTSCYRGIPGQYMASGPALSSWMQALCTRDPELRARRTAVLQEVAGIHVPHPLHEQIEGTPYRYREMLGVTWRESPAAHCDAHERHLLMASLLQTDATSNSVASALIRASGLDAHSWLEQLFGAVVVPLYHLLCRYGIGLVAHAQNLNLMLREHVPMRVILKDFQGDLRLASGDFPERADLPPSAAAVLTELPPEYIYHDLFTGHFVTVLRYLSAQLASDSAVDETDFYAILARVLRTYQQAHPELAARYAQFDLFRPQVERVCINRVRLKLGYDDSAQRPTPIVAGHIDNPLAQAQARQVQPYKAAS